MDISSGSGTNSAHDSEDRDRARCPSLEVGRADHRIQGLAGVSPDTGQSVALSRIGGSLAGTLTQCETPRTGHPIIQPEYDDSAAKTPLWQPRRI